RATVRAEPPSHASINPATTTAATLDAPTAVAPCTSRRSANGTVSSLAGGGSGARTITVSGTGAATNSGTIDLTSADLMFNPASSRTITNRGAITIPANRTATVRGAGTLPLISGSLSGARTFAPPS